VVSELIFGFRGTPLSLRFGSALIDQVYLGSVINLGLVGDFAVDIQVKKEEWRAHLESR
jgi:hypothetical protein